MLPILVRSWRALAIRGFVAIVFGLTALARPATTLAALVLLFGVYVMIEGMLTFSMAARPRALSRAPVLAVKGAAGVGIGIAALLWPQMTTYVLVALIGAWALVTGAFEIALALAVPPEGLGRRLFTAAGVLSVVLGVALLGWPRQATNVIVALVGGWAIFLGAVTLLFALRVRRFGAAHA